MPKAGVLFEQYMFTCAGYTECRRFKTYITAQASEQQLDEAEEDALIQGNVNGFVGWLLVHIGGIGTNGRRQRFYLTYLLQYYGLSREGIDIQHTMGYGVSLDMFDRMKEECVESTAELSRYTKKNNIKIFKNHF